MTQGFQWSWREVLCLYNHLLPNYFKHVCFVCFCRVVVFNVSANVINQRQAV